jgi:hypothetical protein
LNIQIQDSFNVLLLPTGRIRELVSLCTDEHVFVTLSVLVLPSRPVYHAKSME